MMRIIPIILFIFLMLCVPASSMADEKKSTGAPGEQCEKVDSESRWKYAFEFQRAVMRGDMEKATRILDEDPQIIYAKDKNGFTLLHYMVRDNKKDATVMLLDRHASINIRNNYGDTPLDFAAQTGNIEIARLLISKGALVNNTDGVSSPLCRAAGNGHRDMVEFLISVGAKVNARVNSRGWTPLHAAADAGHLDIVKLLLAKGADVNASTEGGMTPLRCASSKGYRDIIKVITEHGGKE
jgi:ankyrin repeat protein